MRLVDNVLYQTGGEPISITAHGVAHGLSETYAGLVNVELPDELSALVLALWQRDAPIKESCSPEAPEPLLAKLVVVVEDDPTVRELAVAMLEETALDVYACASAEEAIALMGKHAQDVAMIFTDVQLAGAVDGVQLVCLASRNWPDVRLVVTSGGAGDRISDLPGKAVFLGKPWRALDVLVQVDQAMRQNGPIHP